MNGNSSTRLKNPITVLVLTFLLAISGFTGASAAENVGVDSSQSTTSSTKEATPQVGVSWAGKKGAKLLAAALRSPTADKVIE